MFDEGLRIKTELMKTIGDILLMFTMNYPDFELLDAPRINVIFTAFSRVDQEQEEEEDIYGNEGEKEMSQSEKWESMKNLYKLTLASVMKEQFGFEEADLKARIDWLLPDERFFSYHEKIDKMAFKQKEWDRLINSSMEAGGKVIDLKTSQGKFMPTSITV